MNAETRAKEIAKIINASGDDHDLITAFGQVVIASALRQAQNEKLEEAARVVAEVGAEDGSRDSIATARGAAKLIRSLKHPKD